jgi:Rrf2 family protein
MNISKTATYSLNILSYMAVNQDKMMSATVLNNKLHIPYPYLRQILSNLSRFGFVKSIRGRNGGYIFSMPTEKISLADILEATDGLETLNRCILGFNQCPFDNKCAMHDVWELTRNNTIKILKETSLYSLAIKRK